MALHHQRQFARDHVRGLLRILSAAGRVSRLRKRLPAQQHPQLISLEYFGAIRHVADLAHRASQHERDEILRDLARVRQEHGKRDAAPPRKEPSTTAARRIAEKFGEELAQATEQGKRAASLIDHAARRFADQLQPYELEAIARKFGRRTTEHNREQLNAQVQAAIGIPFSSIERPILDQVEGWAALNVDLIVSVPERYFDRLRIDVIDAYATGMHPETLAQQFVDRYDIAVDDARRIARDQISKLNADVNRGRLQALGVERYIWRTVNDNRVRDNHADLDGQEFSFDEPPIGGGTDETEEGNPGDGILCRCYPEPIFDELTEETQEEAPAEPAATGEPDEEEDEPDEE